MLRNSASVQKTDHKLRNRHCNYTLPQCDFDVLSIHLSIGVFLHCNFLCVIVIALYYFYCIVFMHVCCVSFNPFTADPIKVLHFAILF